MRVFCLNAPFHRNYSSHQRSPAVTKSRTLYYPIWLAYAAGLLETHGFEVQLVDGPGEDVDMATCVRRARDFAPQLVVVSTSTPKCRVPKSDTVTPRAVWRVTSAPKIGTPS